jgi:nucleoside phosphorylase
MIKHKKQVKNQFSIRWVMALKQEAQPIIEYYKMKLLEGNNVFPIYKNYDQSHWLIISGIGRDNSASATSYLYERSNSSKYTSWINLGIAGGGKGNYGDICLVDKIINGSDTKTSYPDIIKKSNFTRMELLTTDIPITDYESKELIDMEGSAFFNIASKFCSKELIGLIKVISDGPLNDIKKLNKSKIFDLINSNIISILEIVAHYEKLSKNEKKRITKPDLFFQICEKWHFTVTQKYQLEYLVRRINNFEVNDNIMYFLKDSKNSKSVINVITNKIKNYEVDWGSG